MVKFPHLRVFIVFTSFPFILGNTTQNTSTAADIDRFTNGEEFVKKLVDGEKVTKNPGYLLFTAPYRLCEGGCKADKSNFAMVFPIYIGNAGKLKYKSLFERDLQKLHTENPNAPFKVKTTIAPKTPCPTIGKTNATDLTTTKEALILLVTLTALTPGMITLPWDIWTWSILQVPIDNFFRKHQTMLVKSPKLQCECPPHKECAIQYKINEDMAKFLQQQGLIKVEELKQFKQDTKNIQIATYTTVKEAQTLNVGRRLLTSYDIEKSEDCCCSLRNVMLPTFITERKFDTIIDRMKKGKKELSNNYNL